MACEHCSETNFYLADTEALGPCVCVTPEKVAELWEYERQDEALTTERDEAYLIISTAGDHLERYLTRIGLSARAVKLEDVDLDAMLDLLGA